MMYYEAVEIWVAGEKTSIPKVIGAVTKKCTFFTERSPSLEIAQPEHADFRLEVGGLGEVGCFFFNYSDIFQKHFLTLSYYYWIQFQKRQTKL